MYQQSRKTTQKGAQKGNGSEIGAGSKYGRAATWKQQKNTSKEQFCDEISKKAKCTGGMTVETAFEWVTIGVGWLVILTGGFAVVAGLLYLMDVFITRIVNKTKTFAVLFDFVRSRKDFKLYKKDRGAWEEKQRKARDEWTQYYRESMKREG